MSLWPYFLGRRKWIVLILRAKLKEILKGMTREELVEQIKAKRSFLCVGLDTDIRKIPEHLLREENPMLAFNEAIIEATASASIAYKLNIAFYESLGAFGFSVLEQTINYIRTNHPEIFIIADAKRGDIGNTSHMYARSFFEHFKVDALTVAPYMGSDSVTPFLSYKDKWVILLALTSNEGANDFQMLQDGDGKYLFEHVIARALSWENSEHLMLVVGATKTDMLQRIRTAAPDNFLLVPGIGAQGGDFSSLVQYAMTDDCGLIVNSSRGIIYADSSERFALTAGYEAEQLRRQMEEALLSRGII